MTTVVSVRHNGHVVIAGDGQATLGNTVVKGNVKKVRRPYNDKVIAGFTGGTVDASTLFELFECKPEVYQDHLVKAAVELAKDWRTDRMLRGLRAPLAVADENVSLIITGNGDVVQPENDLIIIGSGGPYAQVAAHALLENTDMGTRDIVKRALDTADDVCIYTNHSRTIEELPSKAQGSPMPKMTPREIVSELDRHIISQSAVKRSVAITLRDRWHRMQLSEELRHEVMPRNILMIDPTGVDKTEIARRLVKPVDASFIKAEATKFTEVGYIGKEVDSITCDLTNVAIKMVRMQSIDKSRYRAEEPAEEHVLGVLIPPARNNWGQAEQLQEPFTARQAFRKKLREGQLGDKEIEIGPVTAPVGVEVTSPSGMEETTSQLQSMSQNLDGQRQKLCKLKIRDTMKLLIEEGATKLANPEELRQEVIDTVEQHDIVFTDGIDKVYKCGGNSSGPDVSHKGAQRDLLPLVGDCTVLTKHGMVKTDHTLFIISGAFQVASPPDLTSELQGRLPIRAELKTLTTHDSGRILTEPNASIAVQYKALMAIEGVSIEFTEDGIRHIAQTAWWVNGTTENTGAYHLYIVLERLMGDISYNASEMNDQTVIIDAEYMNKHLDVLVAGEDLSRFILRSGAIHFHHCWWGLQPPFLSARIAMTGISHSWAWPESPRPKMLPLTSTAVTIGTTLVWRQGHSDSWVALLALIAVGLLQIFSSLADDCGDTVKGSGRPDRIEPLRDMQKGVTTPQQMKYVLIVAVMLICLLGLVLLCVAWQSVGGFTGFLMLGGLSIVAVITYTMGTRPYGYIGLGDISVLVFFSWLSVLGSWYPQAHNVEVAISLPATACGLSAIAMLNINNLRGINSDWQSGKSTLAVRLGLVNARHHHACLLLGALPCLALFNLLALRSAWGWLFILATLLLVKQAYYVPRESDPLVVRLMLEKTVKGTLLTNLLFVIEIIANKLTAQLTSIN